MSRNTKAVLPDMAVEEEKEKRCINCGKLMSEQGCGIDGRNPSNSHCVPEGDSMSPAQRARLADPSLNNAGGN